MTKRERLIELIKQGDKTFADKYTGKVMSHIDEIYDFLADYLLANGEIAPGCKVGDFLYKPKKVGSRWAIVEYVITAIMSIEKDEWIIRYRKDRGQTHHQCSIDEIGKTVFLSREEAEQAKGGEGK